MRINPIGRRSPTRAVSLTAVLATAALLLGLTGASVQAAADPGPSRVLRLPAPRSVEPLRTRSPRTLAPRVRRAMVSIAAEKKAVVVVGPVGNSTARYIDMGEAIAAAAEAWGMEVVRIYPPNATWERVVDEANGADVFVYLGHGNGWPSPYAPFQEQTKNGLGLNRFEGDTDYAKTKYYGADFVRGSIRFAPNAVVLLNHLCYAEGNGEPGMPIPTVDVARQRVDNFAAGFLAAGARAVFAYGWQPGRSLVDALFSPTPMTMDDVFMTRHGGPGTNEPYYGWVGWQPDLYFDSARTPGARNHLDVDQNAGYLRAVTGDLGFTTSEWQGRPDVGDTQPPVLSGLRGQQAADTTVAGDVTGPVFTPNGDKISDRIRFRYSVTEGAFLRVDVRDAAGVRVRAFTTWSEAGPGAFSWDGREDGGRFARDGTYELSVTPRDRAGNRGSTERTAVMILTAMRSPAAAPSMFHPADGDALAQRARFSVTLGRAASLTWRILDGDGTVVRRGMVDRELPAGPAGWDFDGRDDAGAPLPEGTYRSTVTARTADGAYSHQVQVRIAPYLLKGALDVAPGTSQTLTLLTAEPLSGWPRITVKQPGLAAYRLSPVRYSSTRFTARWVVRSGSPGTIVITVTATDTGGGVETRRFWGRLQ